MSSGAGHFLVEDEAALDEVVKALLDASEYAVDTEFHRERTYFPTAALVQIKWDEQIALIDPLAVDLRPLAPVLTGPGLAIMHAASQDLEVLQRACGAVPSRLFDTQLAAGFLGFTTPSLASLAERVDAFSALHVLQQFLLYVPLGSLLAVWPLRLRGRWAHLWPGVWLAVVIELGHLVIVERTFDVTNALVACAGLGIGWIVVRRSGFAPYGEALAQLVDSSHWR